MNVGKKDGVYPNFVKFTTKEIEKYIVIYVFRGISPSPRVKMKFRPYDRDGFNSNNFIERHVPNGDQRHKKFKCSYLCKTRAFIILLERLIPFLDLIHFSDMYRK